MTWAYHQLSALLSERLDEQNEISEFCHYRIWLFDVGVWSDLFDEHDNGCEDNL
jgi:hypothetical protein